MKITMSQIARCVLLLKLLWESVGIDFNAKI